MIRGALVGSVVLLAACSRPLPGVSDDTSDDATDDPTLASSESESDDSSESESSGPGCLETCPDGTCAPLDNRYGCCEHGGPCPPPSPCDAQDAASGVDECEAPEFAWDGAYCYEVCACVGSDCDALYDSPSACLSDHAACGEDYELADCFFDAPVAPVEVAGVVLDQPVELTAGAFGDYLDERGVPGVELHLAPDTLALANYIVTDWMMLGEWGVIVVGPAPVAPGVHVVPTHIAGTQTFTDATLTITEIDDGPDLAARELVGEVTIDQPGWALTGSFGVRYCAGLDSKF